VGGLLVSFLNLTPLAGSCSTGALSALIDLESNVNRKLKRILGLMLVGFLLLTVMPLNTLATETEKKNVAELYVTSW
jgi:hypothetical protein